MVWTLITFGIAVFVLWKYAFGPLQRIIDAASRQRSRRAWTRPSETRAEAQRLLDEYKQTLAKVRGEAEEILERSRTAGEHAKAELIAEAKRRRSASLAQAHEQIERDTRAALRELQGPDRRAHRCWRPRRWRRQPRRRPTSSDSSTRRWRELDVEELGTES